MKSSAKNIKLTSVDELFSTEQERQEVQDERIVRLPLTELHYFKGYPAMQSEVPFSGQPYKVRDDDPVMLAITKSIKRRGVRTPGLARPDPDGAYELIAGHRRHRGSELAEVPDMPVIIRNLSDEEAVIELVDSNLQREDVLPSERAWALRMKLEAIKRQAGRPSNNSPQVAANFRSDDEIAEAMGISGDTVRRFIRLTELIPELLDMVDAKKIAVTPASELSFLKKDEQQFLLETMESEQATPSLSQAQRLKKFSQEGRLTEDSMLAIISEEKKGDLDKVTLSGEKLKKYFPKSYTPQQMEDVILKLLEQWQRKRQREQER